MKRKITQKLLDWKNKPNHKPLILKGARQVGKTYILEEVCLTNSRVAKMWPHFEKEMAPQIAVGPFSAVRTRPHFTKILPVLSKTFLHK